MLGRLSVRSCMFNARTCIPIVSGTKFASVRFSNCVRTFSTEPVTSTNSIPRTTLKPLDSRKTHLVDDYSRLVRSNAIILVVHYGGLLKAENETIRQQIRKAGGKLIVTRSKLFQVALRGLEHPDPASKEAHQLYSKNKHPLGVFFSGPSAVITIPDINPAAAKNVIKVLDKSGDRLILLGAQIDGTVQDRAAIEKFKELPSLDQLRAELAGVLTILGGAGLVQTLEATGKVLYLTMENRKEQLQPTEELESKQ